MIHGLLLSGAVRAAVVLAAGLAAYAVSRHAAAATRRLVLVLTLGASIVVPVASAIGPRWTVRTPVELPAVAHESANEVAQLGASASPSIDVGRARSRGRVASSFDARDALALAWLVVAGALLVRAAASHARVRAIVRRAKPVAGAAWNDAGVDVRVSSELDSPAVAGIFRPTLVVPRVALGWSLERARLVLVHELAHVRRRDVLAQTVADLACAIHWCNPLAWICARRLRVEREIAADDAVLAAGVRPSRYAEELVSVATAASAPRAALAMAERSSLETRVASILASRIARAPLAARWTAAITAVGVALAAAAACTSPEAAGTSLAPRLRTDAIDPAIQQAAEAEIAAIDATWSPELATIVVLDPVTGAILADAGRASNVAIAPGSTLKPIVVAAALEERAIRVDQEFECAGPRMYGDRALDDASESGTLDLAHLLAVSSNVGASRVFDALGGDALGAWLRRFHFGRVGTVPARIVTGSYDGAAVAMGVGMTATPREMVAAYGVLANDGVSAAGERLVSSETARSVLSLLETVVVDGRGTGKAARVPGVRVVGKTGTSEWTAADGRSRTYASFIGIADLRWRRIVVLVGIEASRDDMSGGSAAAPVFARLVTRFAARSK